MNRVFKILDSDLRSLSLRWRAILEELGNLQIVQINANKYALSKHGFNSSTANELLSIDSRAVYISFYSKVLWCAQDVVLMVRF